MDAEDEDVDETEIGPAPRPSTQPPQQLPQTRPCLLVVGGESAGHLFMLDRAEVYAGRAPGNMVRLPDADVSPIHARFIAGKTGLEVEGVGKALVSVNGSNVERALLNDGDRVALGAACTLLLVHIDAPAEAIEDNLSNGTTRDLLTGAWTRRRLIAELEREVAYARRHQMKLTLLVATASWPGHNHEPESISRAVVASVAERIRSCLESGDWLARWSNTGFIIFARSAEHAVTANLTLRIARSVTTTPVKTELGERSVSLHVVPISASGPDSLSVESLVTQADGVTQNR